MPMTSHQEDTVIHHANASLASAISRWVLKQGGLVQETSGLTWLLMKLLMKMQLHLHSIFLHCLPFALVYFVIFTFWVLPEQNLFWFHDTCPTFHLAAKLQVANRKTTKLIMVKTRSKKKDRLALAKHGKAWQNIAAKGSTHDLSR